MRPLRLSPSATLTPTGRGVIVRSDLSVFQIASADAGKLAATLSQILDGSRDREGIQAALAGCSAESVSALLDLLTARGVVEEVPEPGSDETRRGQMAFLRRWPSSPADAMDRIGRARVVLAGDGTWGEVAAAELAAAGVGAIDRLDAGAIGGEGVLLLACVPAHDGGEADRLARLAHLAGVRSLWSRIDGGRAVLGPLTVPGRTACRACAGADGINALPEPPAAPGRGAASMARILGHLLALEALKILSGYAPSALGGRVLVEDLTTFESELRTLVRLPWCHVCGQGAGAPTPPGAAPRSR